MLPGIPLQSINDPLLAQRELSLQVLRLDQLPRAYIDDLSAQLSALSASEEQSSTSLASTRTITSTLEKEAIEELLAALGGNKYFKLKNNLLAARENGFSRLLSFGGDYSNHLYALAAAGKLFGFETIAVVRGERKSPLSACLADAERWGMQLHFVSRSQYRDYRQQINQLGDDAGNLSNVSLSDSCCSDLYHQFGPAWLIPEGGANHLASLACADIAASIMQHLADQPIQQRSSHYVAMACGTGGSLAGVLSGLAQPLNVIGVPVLKAKSWLENDIQQHLQDLDARATASWQLWHDFHCGGYAKTNADLLQFIGEFQQQHAIPLEPVYTGKLFYALWQGIKVGRFPAGSRIIAIHTGGLQGRRGFNGG